MDSISHKDDGCVFFVTIFNTLGKLIHEKIEFFFKAVILKRVKVLEHSGLLYSISRRFTNSRRFEAMYRQRRCQNSKYLKAVQNIVISFMPILFTGNK